MKKIFLLLAFTGIVGAASATSVAALTKGTVITRCGDDKKDGKKKCSKKSCCKSKAAAQGESGCAGAKSVEAKTCNHSDKASVKSCTKSAEASAEVKDVKSEVSGQEK